MADNPDLVIRGGSIADGLGGELFEADVAITGGRITEVGRVPGKGKEKSTPGASSSPPALSTSTPIMMVRSPGARTSRHRRKMASRQRSWAIAGWDSRPVVRQTISG
jgi:Adenine deaminase